MHTLGIDIGGGSVKAAVIGPAGKARTATSQRYTKPDRDGLTGAIRECLAILNMTQPQRVGLCLPGRMSPDQTSIELAVNLPVLNGWLFSDLLASVFESPIAPHCVVSDADAAGYDFATSNPIAGRTAAVALGTGVGLCVLDANTIVTIGTKGIGHLGDMNIGRFGTADRTNASGTRNSPESYFGAPSLEPWSSGLTLDLAPLAKDDLPIQAIVRTLQVIHAIYLPDRIALLGGVGLAFKPHAGMICDLVNDGLTPLAVQGWTLDFASSAHHAALGAAKLAAQVS